MSCNEFRTILNRGVESSVFGWATLFGPISVTSSPPFPGGGACITPVFVSRSWSFFRSLAPWACFRPVGLAPWALPVAFGPFVVAFGPCLFLASRLFSSPLRPGLVPFAAWPCALSFLPALGRCFFARRTLHFWHRVSRWRRTQKREK